MSNEMIIIIASPEARTEVGMSRSLNNANLKRDRNSPLNCRGALPHGTETDRYTQTNKYYPRIHDTNPDQAPPRELIDQRISWLSIYKNGPEAKTYNPGFKRGTSRRTAKQTQGIYVYLNVCKMSTHQFIDLDTEEAYNAEKVTITLAWHTDY